MPAIDEIELIDDELAARARGEAALRLRLGQALEVLSRGGVFELGFSSMAAYAVERCERGTRWAEVARCLARRLEKLPALRQAVAVGRVSWSMAELLARVAHPHDEARWMEEAESRTVRQMRVHVAKAVACQQKASSAGQQAYSALLQGGVYDQGDVAEGDVAEGDVAEGDVAEGEADAPAAKLETPALTDEGAAWSESSSDGEDMCTLTCTVNQDEAWLFEATRSLLAQLGVHGTEAQAEALLAEAQSTLLTLLPEGALDLGVALGPELAQQRWVSQLGCWRTEAEVLCELNQRRWRRAHRDAEGGAVSHGAASHGAAASAAQLGMASLERLSHEALDAAVRALAEAMARHELELSLLVLRFHRADGWRRLGYASETQYARERLGTSRSSHLARRLLALRLEKLPVVAAALGAGQLGVEATVQVVRVATVSTQTEWVARAQQRTIKHLKEEVVAALTAVRWSGEVDCPPPADAELGAFQVLEQAVVSGRLSPAQRQNGEPSSERTGEQGRGSAVPCAPGPAEPMTEPRRAWLVMLASLAEWLHSGIRMSAMALSGGRSHAASGAGRVALRLRMSRATAAWWHGLEAQAHRCLPCGMSWLRFVCRSLWSAWQHLLGTDVAYGHIYIRDRYRCMSPVCNRRDVTPHHLVFRSAGGSDAAPNVATICSWCHLRGVHGGRIRARGTAQLVHWELGAPSSPCLVVNGRQRVAA